MVVKVHHVFADSRAHRLRRKAIKRALNRKFRRLAGDPEQEIRFKRGFAYEWL